MKALVLGGGGSKGAYHVGALEALMERGYRFDLYAGVSVGALVAAFMAQYQDDEAEEGHQALATLFCTIETRDIWRHWPFFRRTAGLWKPSIYNSKYLRRLVETHIDPLKVHGSGKKLRMGAVDIQTRQYVVFDEQTDMLHAAVTASASIPFAFLPTPMHGSLFVDGGVRAVTPLGAAIKAGATEVMAITLQPKHVLPDFDHKPNALDIALRSIEIMSDEIIANDIKIAQLYTKIRGLSLACEQSPKERHGAHKQKRAVHVTHIRPTEPLGVRSDRFIPADAVRLYRQGYEDAQRVLG